MNKIIAEINIIIKMGMKILIPLLFEDSPSEIATAPNVDLSPSIIYSRAATIAVSNTHQTLPTNTDV